MEELKIKKVLFGGYDKDDVMKHIQTITEFYQKQILELEKQEKELSESYRIRFEAMGNTIASLDKKVEKVKTEKENLKDSYKEYCMNMQKKYTDSLRFLSGEFTKILENVSVLQQNIIEVENLEFIEVMDDNEDEQE